MKAEGGRRKAERTNTDAHGRAPLAPETAKCIEAVAWAHLRGAAADDPWWAEVLELTLRLMQERDAARRELAEVRAERDGRRGGVGPGGCSAQGRCECAADEDG